MGLFKKIGHRLRGVKRIGQRFAHNSAIGLRKVGHSLGRVAEMAPKIGGALSIIGATTGLAPPNSRWCSRNGWRCSGR